MSMMLYECMRLGWGCAPPASPHPPVFVTAIQLETDANYRMQPARVIYTNQSYSVSQAHKSSTIDACNTKKDAGF